MTLEELRKAKRTQDRIAIIAFVFIITMLILLALK